MVRRILVVAALSALSALSCKDGGGTTADGGKPPAKLVCKVDNQCMICPDEAAMKKCIINPTTSGCKLAAAGDCAP